MNKARLFELFFGTDIGNVPQTAVITPFIPLGFFGAFADASSIFKGKIYSGFIAHRGTRRVLVARSGIGSALSGDEVMLLASAGVKHVIFAGSAGGLGGPKTGDIIIPWGAFDGEGFSRYFDRKVSTSRIISESMCRKGDEDLVKRFEAFVHKHTEEGSNYFKGPVFTIGTIVGESREVLSDIQGLGCLGVEMELSAVYKAAEVCGIKAAASLVVSDLPLEKDMVSLDVRDRVLLNEKTRVMARMIMDFSFSL